VIARYPSVFKPSYIEKTKAFYQTHGGKTVVLARFFVVVRTFAPFVAGVANMSYKKFIAFNVLGGFSWVGSFMTLGYFFGQLPWVEENFALAMAAVVALSAVPMFVELAKHFFGGKDEDELIKDVDATIDDIAGSFDEPERVPGGLGA
jgi:membrane-associated protein